MASPRCEELNEDGLSGDCVVPSIGSELDGVSSGQKAKQCKEKQFHGKGNQFRKWKNITIVEATLGQDLFGPLS